MRSFNDSIAGLRACGYRGDGIRMRIPECTPIRMQNTDAEYGCGIRMRNTEFTPNEVFRIRIPDPDTRMHLKFRAPDQEDVFPTS